MNQKMVFLLNTTFFSAIAVLHALRLFFDQGVAFGSTSANLIYGVVVLAVLAWLVSLNFVHHREMGGLKLKKGKEKPIKFDF
jgi:hypothetical protein